MQTTICNFSGPPVNIGTANSTGSTKNIALADHVHQGVHSLALNSTPTSQFYGDITVANGNGIGLGFNGNVLTISNTATGTGGTGGFIPKKYMFCDGNKNPGTGGGNYLQNKTWITRDLNTVIYTTDSDATLNTSLNTFTLVPGTWAIRVTCPSVGLYNFRCALYDETASAFLFYGSSEYTRSVDNISSTLNYVWTVSTNTNYSIKFYSNFTGSTTNITTAALGTPVGIKGVNEIYTQVVLERIA